MTMIGIDPHKATHTAVAVDDNEHVVDKLQLLLNEAQSLLQQAEQDSTTVTAVAHDLGIRNLSRFAKSYRSLFDESPSDTLWA
jgi:AraC-like DNA-binding protein